MFKIITLFFLLCLNTYSAFAEVLPTLLSKNQREEVLPYFSNSYPQQILTRPYFLGNYPGIEVGTSVSYRSLSELQKSFPLDSIRDQLVLTQLFIKKSLIHRLELTFSTTLSSLGTTQASGFGGMLTWHPFKTDQVQILPIISIYTNYLNYEDAITYQESGGQISIGKNLKLLSLKGGLSLSKFSARFAGINNGRQITDTGQTENTSIFLETYFASISTNVGPYLITFSQNYSLESNWNPSITVSYEF